MVHTPLPAAAAVPASQGVVVLLPSHEWPAAHSVHEKPFVVLVHAPTWSWWLSHLRLSHGRHGPWPSFEEYVEPSTQSVQVDSTLPCVPASLRLSQLDPSPAGHVMWSSHAELSTSSLNCSSPSAVHSSHLAVPDTKPQPSLHVVHIVAWCAVHVAPVAAVPVSQWHTFGSHEVRVVPSFVPPAVWEPAPQTSHVSAAAALYFVSSPHGVQTSLPFAE
jgi:hypothetical protein